MLINYKNPVLLERTSYILPTHIIPTYNSERGPASESNGREIIIILFSSNNTWWRCWYRHPAPHRVNVVKYYRIDFVRFSMFYIDFYNITALLRNTNKYYYAPNLYSRLIS